MSCQCEPHASGTNRCAFCRFEAEELYEERKTMSDQTKKLDAGKAPLWLVPWEALEPMIPEPARAQARQLHDWAWRRGPAPKLDPQILFRAAPVLAFGAKKYSPGGWERGVEFTRIVSAGLRHAMAFGTLDGESGLPHEGHLACNVLFAAIFEARGDRYASQDDRPRPPEPKREPNIYRDGLPNGGD